MKQSIFSKYREIGPFTVLLNLRHSLTPPKYLNDRIMTTIHRKKNECSKHELFPECVKEMKDNFQIESGQRLVEYKIHSF